MGDDHYKPASDYTSLDHIQRQNEVTRDYAAQDRVSRERDALHELEEIAERRPGAFDGFVAASLRDIRDYGKRDQVADAFKETNPKDAVGVSKVPASTVSAPVIAELGLGMLEGALKYGRHNYRESGVRASVYYDAVFRHMTAWWEGEDIDPDTIVRDEKTGEVIFAGLSHVSKIMAAAAVIRDAMIQGKFIDDRPPPSPAGWQAPLNQGVKALLRKYPDPVAAHLANGQRGPGRILEKA